MHQREYNMESGGGLSDRLIEDGRGGSLNGTGVWGADARRTDDLMSDSISHSRAGYRTLDNVPHAEHEPPWPFHRPYEPEMPPPACYERPAPPPPAVPPGPPQSRSNTRAVG